VRLYLRNKIKWDGLSTVAQTTIPAILEVDRKEKRRIKRKDGSLS
jgi:hypothetical protein